MKGWAIAFPSLHFRPRTSPYASPPSDPLELSGYCQGRFSGKSHIRACGTGPSITVEISGDLCPYRCQNTSSSTWAYVSNTPFVGLHSIGSLWWTCLCMPLECPSDFRRHLPVTVNLTHPGQAWAYPYRVSVWGGILVLSSSVIGRGLKRSRCPYLLRLIRTVNHPFPVAVPHMTSALIRNPQANRVHYGLACGLVAFTIHTHEWLFWEEGERGPGSSCLWSISVGMLLF